MLMPHLPRLSKSRVGPTPTGLLPSSTRRERTDCTRYYRVSEDKTATNDFTDFWPSDGRMILNGKTFKTAGAMLAVKQSLLPPNGNKAWWHLIEGANVVAENATTKTINAKIVIQTTYTPGNCSQAQYVNENSCWPMLPTAP